VDTGLLKDLLVVDCASFIAGPAAATILADFGARVIKVEPPSGDTLRHVRHSPGMPQSEHDYYWLLDDRNKDGIALDLKQKEAQEVLHRLIAKADVFVTNFPGPIRERLQIRADDLLPRYEKLVYASLTPYGDEGPERDRTGYDATAYWARSGLMDAVTGDRNLEPRPSVPGMGDHPTSVALFGAIMLGLYRRAQTGKGGQVSTSLLGNGLWSFGSLLQASLCDAEFTPRAPRGERPNALTDLYTSEDQRWFMLAILNQVREWPLLLQCLDHPHWSDDQRFATPEARAAHSHELFALLDHAFRQFTWADLSERFERLGITVGVISQLGDEAVDRQIEANNFLPEIEGLGVRTVDSPVRLHGVEKVKPRRAPDIGEHTEAVLAEFGYSNAEIETLMRSGAAYAPSRRAMAGE